MRKNCDISTVVVQIDEFGIYIGNASDKEPTWKVDLVPYKQSWVPISIVTTIIQRYCLNTFNCLAEIVRVVLVLDIFVTRKQKKELCDGLFNTLNVPITLWMCAPLTAILSTSTRDAIIVDIGMKETKFIVILDLCILMHYTKTSKRSLSTVLERMADCFKLNNKKNSQKLLEDEEFAVTEALMKSLLKSRVPSKPTEELYQLTDQEAYFRYSDILPLAETTCQTNKTERGSSFNDAEKIRVPSWIANAGIEALFEGSDAGGSDIADQALPNVLLSLYRILPIDIRRIMSKLIVFNGILPSLPGWYQRFQNEMTSRGLAIKAVPGQTTADMMAWNGASTTCESQLDYDPDDPKHLRHSIVESPLLYGQDQYFNGENAPEWW